MNDDLLNRDQMLAYLAATGLNNAQIARNLNIDPHTVGIRLKDAQVQFEIKHLRYKLYGKDHKKRFNDILPHAIDVTEEILSNPNSKPQIKFAAAQEVFDRALGKSRQTIEHEGSLVRALFEKLDSKKDVGPAIDVKSPKETIVADSPNERLNLTSNKNPNVNEDLVDTWVNKHL